MKSVYYSSKVLFILSLSLLLSAFLQLSALRNRLVSLNVVSPDTSFFVDEPLSGTGQEIVPVPNVFPPDGTRFATQMKVNLFTNNEDVTAFEYTANNADFDYASANRPLDYNFVVSNTTVISAQSVVGTEYSEEIEVTYTKVPIGLVPDTLEIACDASGSKATLSWEKDPDVDLYMVEIEKDGELNLFDIENLDRRMMISSDTGSVIIEGLEAGASYNYARVQPLLNENLEDYNVEITEELGRDIEFSCASADATIPVVTNYIPRTNIQKYEISGTKTSNVNVMVNDEVIPTETGNTLAWSYELELEKGINQVIIKNEAETVEENQVEFEIEYCELGDISCDGKVDIFDFSDFVKALTDEFKIENGEIITKQELHMLADMDFSGANDIGDFTIFREAYLENN